MINTDDIRRAVSHNAFNAGLQYQIEGRVRDVRTDRSSDLIEARVQGSGRTPYKQVVQLHHGRDGRLSIMGSCTCPVGFNCKHVVAALLAHQAETGIPSKGAQPSFPLRPVSERPPIAASNLVRTELPPQSTETALSHEVYAWLRGLEAAEELESEDYPPTVRKRVLYVLDRASHTGDVFVEVRSMDLKRDDTPGAASRRLNPHQLLRAGQPPQFVRPSDRFILRRLASDETVGAEGFLTTLRAILATGRSRWGDWTGPVLSEGDPIAGEITWVVADDGRQQPQLTVSANAVGLRLASPWYVDPSTGVMGSVDTGMPPRLLHAMLAAPPVMPAAVNRVRDELQRRWPQHKLPAPKPVATPEIIREKLQPRLLLLAGKLPFDPNSISTPGRYRLPTKEIYRAPLARLSWEYGPVQLSSGGRSQPDQIVQRNGVLLQVIRDYQAEGHAAECLRRIGLGRLRHYHSLPEDHPHAEDWMLVDPDPGVWIDVMLDDIPALRLEGWFVDVAEDFPLRLAEPSGNVSFEVCEGSGIDWFDLDLGVMVEGERISLVPALLNFIADAGAILALGHSTAFEDHTPPLLLPLPDGRILAVPFHQLQRILPPLMELLTGADLHVQDGAVRLLRRDAADLALLEAATAVTGIAWAGGERVRELGRQLREPGGIPPHAVPASFAATLRPYQQQGLAWLQFLRSAGMGGILADDMGLGKTVQALAHMAVEQAEGRLTSPALVVCPTSLVANWQAEASRLHRRCARWCCTGQTERRALPTSPSTTW
jgi:hypothetical protein